MRNYATVAEPLTADEKEKMVSIVQVEVKVMQGSTGLVRTKPLKKCNKKDPDRAGRGLSKEQSEG